nr:MBOAT family protein [Fredinandcohnia onubensis]
MVFSSLIFLFVFLPIVIFTYFIVGKRFRNILLLLFSLFFYAWGEPKYVLLMIFSIIMNYIFGLIVDKLESKSALKKAVLVLAIIGNLLIIGYYKYINFIVDNINQLLGLSIHIEEVPLPIGISFFTFQALSYVIDVYRKDSHVQKNPFDLALYISLFPQLVAGPIVRYNDIANQIKDRIINSQKFSEGIRRFIIGLAKKVLIANQTGFIADQIFSMNPEEISTSLAWIGIISYTLQIYFDFSGYSDMAIGLGKMFGFEFLENFNYPYISRSITEFWRRWHISLSTWFRDYVYIPLGGNRVTTLKHYRNIFLVWALTGLWHGASWTFVAWGLYYGILLTIEKLGLGKLLKRTWAPIQHLYVLVIVMIGWVFFRADNFSYSLNYIKTLFGIHGQGLVDRQALYYIHDYGLLYSIAILCSTPIINKLILAMEKSTNRIIHLLIRILYIVLLILTIIYLVNSTYNPFIYFRF